MKEDILKYCEFLINEHHYKVDSLQYNPKHFGDFLIKLKSDFVNVHYLRDRAQYFIGISSLTEGHNLFHIEYVILAIDNQDILPNTEINIDKLNALLETYYEKIITAFSSNNYSEIKSKLEKIRQRYSTAGLS